MKKILDRFAEGQAPMHGWGGQQEPTDKELLFIVVGLFLGVIVAKFFGM
jgi:hypothetical protein